MRTFGFCCVLTFVGLPLTADPGTAPVLQWVKQISGSGQSLATASAVDSQGNLYITGNTASADFPTASAAQPRPGGSTLTRVDAPSGVAQKLYDPLLSSAANFAFDPQNPSNIYATSSSSTGVTDAGSNWTNYLIRSTDGGTTWMAVSAFPPIVSGTTGSKVIMDCLAIDPANSNVLYACPDAEGILKSIDGGLTWTAINQGLPSYSASQPRPVYHVWVDPNLPSAVFAASQTGLVRSSDAGATWSLVLPGEPFLQGALAFDPFTPGTIYFGGSYSSQLIQKSADDGLTWTPVSQLPLPLFGSCDDCLVYIDPVHPGVWYFASANYMGGLYRSDDAGATWTLKVATPVNAVAFNPGQGIAYAIVESPSSIIVSSDAFNTYQPWQPVRGGTSIQVVGKQVFVGAPITTDVFITKLDPDGNIVYSTYFGGSAADSPTGLATGTDGSVYVTGTTGSSDFPTTTGAFLTTVPAGGPASFVFKLYPDGSLGWSTYFADVHTTPNAIAVDASGSPYVTGTTFNGLPVTSGVLQTQPPGTAPCPPGTITGCPNPSSAGFLTRFKADGSGLIFSTYVYSDATRFLFSRLSAIALDALGNAYVSGTLAEQTAVALLSPDGATLLASNAIDYHTCSNCLINAIALDANGDFFAAGSGETIPATPGAFQSAPKLPGGGAQIQAFVFKFDPALFQITAATYLGGEYIDQAQSLALDSGGNVIVSGSTSSKGFPTRDPFQSSFSQQSGFVAGLDSGLSTLLYSTYVGDQRYFGVAGAFPDNQGNILLAGSLVDSAAASTSSYAQGDGDAIFANKIALTAPPAVRLDSVNNAASLLGVSLSPGETIAAVGAGFGSDSQLMMNGVPLPIVAQTANLLTAQLPADLGDADAAVITALSGGVTSNSIVAPIAVASPGLYSAAGSGLGQGYILNSDGSTNSPTNPAAAGSAITIFATGVGSITEDGPYAVTAQPVSVFIDSFYANGISASLVQVPGLPAGTYALSVYVPSPPFKMPPEAAVVLVSGAVGPGGNYSSSFHSQLGLTLSVQQ